MSVLVFTIFASKAYADENACLPNGFHQPKSQISSTRTRKPSKAGKGVAYAFVDGSPNMAGFVGGANSLGREPGPRNLLHSLPFALSDLGLKVRYHRVIGGVTPIAVRDGADLLERSLFMCTKGNSLSRCLSSRSALSTILPMINKGAREDLFVLVSDLSMDSREFVGDEGQKLRKTFAAVLQSNRSIGIIALSGRFKGVVYDLPSGRRYSKANKRPLYLLAIGKRELVIQLFEKVSREVLNNVPEKNKNLVLFADKVIKKTVGIGDWKDTDFEIKKGVRPDPTLIRNIQDIRKYRLEPKHGPLLARINMKDILVPYSLPVVEFELKQRLWQYRPDNGACNKRWLQLKNRAPLVVAERQDRAIQLRIFGDPSSTRRLPSRRTYVLSSSISAKSIGQDEEFKKWISDWSFDDLAEQGLIAENPRFFPTLNLKRLIQLLQQAVEKNSSSELLAQFDVIFHVDR
jgi:hypothetical protein